MNKCFLTFILGIAILSRSSGQAVVKGRVKDSLKASVPFCTLALLNAKDGKPKRGIVGDSSGYFVFDRVVPGNYVLKVSRVGFSDYYSRPILVDTIVRVIDAGDIMLSVQSIRMKEATVSGSMVPAIEFRTGMVIMNVENNPLALGNTVLDLLKRIPGVVLDADNNITIIGRGSVRFLMDGRLQQVPLSQLIILFSTMTAESISKIELIKNPSAKYDASGSAGLINIVTKKIRIRGLSGNVFESPSLGERFGNNAGVNINLRSDKLVVFGSALNSYREIGSPVILNRSIISSPFNVQNIDLQGLNILDRHAWNFRGGIEYSPTVKTTIGINANVGPVSSKDNDTSNTHISGGSSLPYSQLATHITVKDHFQSPTYTFFALQNLGNKESQLSFTADYVDFSTTHSDLNANHFLNDNGQDISPFVNYMDSSDLKFKLSSLKLDLTERLNNSYTLEAGLKSSIAKNQSTSAVQSNNPGTDMYNVIPEYTNDFVYNEKVFAGYAQLTKDFSKVVVQAGIRGEQTVVDENNEDAHFQANSKYVNLFPSFSLNYKINGNQNLQLAYSYRIDRPSYDQLNPGKTFNSQLDYSTGNPNLQPQYGHNITMDYNYKNFLISSISYAHINNSIYSYSYTNESLQQVDTVFNFASRNALSFNVVLQKQVRKWYALQLSGIVAYTNSSGEINGTYVNTQSFTVMGSLNNDVILPKGYRFQLSAKFTAPYTDGIQHYYTRGTLDFAAQRSLAHNKITIGLNVLDILYTDYSRYRSELQGQSYYYSLKNDTRRVRLTLIYRFGKLRINKKSDNLKEEDTDRIKNKG
jgi:outer membrane receptor protein involved in Fe transport